MKTRLLVLFSLTVLFALVVLLLGGCGDKDPIIEQAEKFCEPYGELSNIIIVTGQRVPSGMIYARAQCMNGFIAEASFR